MTHPKMGNKHICANCGARFFDMNKNPAICPKCGTQVGGDTPQAEEAPAPDEDVVEDVLDMDVDVEDVEGGEDDSLMEDASDLDDDDMSGVIENMDDDVEDKA